MKNDGTILALLAIAGIGAYFLLRNQAKAEPLYRHGPVYGTGTALLQPIPTIPTIPTVTPPAEEPGFLETAFEWLTTWGDEAEKSPSEWRTELLPLIRAQESAFEMPAGLLDAVIQNESGFRHDIITGLTEGDAGEQGIMQLKPQFHMASPAERNNPRLAIPYGATYLAKNFIRFGNWREAVIAYNCGPTDWEEYGALRCGPALDYLAKIETRIGALA